jgi:protein SCO1/2
MTRLGLALVILTCAAQQAAAMSRPDFTPKSGTRVDLSLAMTDASNATAPLGAFTAGKPALLLFGYHRCPNLCGIAQLELAQALTATGVGADRYSVLFASIDPQETASGARAARDKLAAADPAADLSSWHFLTGTEATLTALEGSLALRADRREGSDLYVHPVAASVLTPDGRLSRVFPGIDYAPGDLRLALIEASEGRLGTFVDRIVLICSGFDATTGRYTNAIVLGLRAACVLALLLLASLLIRLERSRRVR